MGVPREKWVEEEKGVTKWRKVEKGRGYKWKLSFPIFYAK